MLKMSRAQTRFYMGRLSLFYSIPEMCKLLSATRPTIERYLINETQPSINRLALFQEAMLGLVDHLDKHEKKWAFGRAIADLLEDEQAPKSFVNAVADESEHVRRWLLKTLTTPKRSKVLFAEAAELEFTRPQVLYAAKRLNVIKRQHGQGRGSHSIWRLP